jgi:hypothetical protein
MVSGRRKGKEKISQSIFHNNRPGSLAAGALLILWVFFQGAGAAPCIFITEKAFQYFFSKLINLVGNSRSVLILMMD